MPRQKIGKYTVYVTIRFADEDDEDDVEMAYDDMTGVIEALEYTSGLNVRSVDVELLETTDAEG